MPELTDHSIDETAECTVAEYVDGQYRLVATRSFEPGGHILRLRGEIKECPSKFSVQIGPDQHMEVPAEVQATQPLDRYRWRFLNHSCEPNAKFENRDLVAIREIEATEQITFDYNTTEYDLATPFECHCGSDNCCGVVRGYRWQEDQARAEG
jgi:hypothetical protein